jgi:hypothetical protein
MSQRTLLIASIALVVGLFSILIFARGTGPLDLISPIFPPPAAPPPAGPPPAPGEERSLEGRVTGVAASARVISLAADGREFELALTSESRILGEQGQSIPLGEVLRGLSLRADGRMTGETTMVPDSVRLLD